MSTLYEITQNMKQLNNYLDNEEFNEYMKGELN